MALNIIENSDVSQFIEKIEDERMKNLLNNMHMEYERYVRAGTIEEFEHYKHLARVPMEDWVKCTMDITKELKSEILCQKNYIEQLESGKETFKKVGRPKKTK